MQEKGCTLIFLGIVLDHFCVSSGMKHRGNDVEMV